MSVRFCWVSLLCIVLGLQGCLSAVKPPKKLVSENRGLMGTYVRIDVCAAPSEEDNIAPALAEAWKRLEEISWRMNVFDEKSDIAKINASFTNPVAVPEDTYYVLEKSVYYSELTQGAFDITVWPIIQLWKKAQKENRMPGRPTIDAVLESVGMDKLLFINDTLVKILHPETRLDLGGIAKGYAIDEAVRILQAHGFTDFQVDAGGDIYLGGKNCKGDPWRIGIRDPRGGKKNLLTVVAASDQAVTTSGRYIQFMVIEGKSFSHIIDPKTGYPQDEVLSATVVAPTALDADALSTALCVLGPNTGNKLIESLGENYASLIVNLKENDKILTFPSKTFKKLILR